MVTDNNINAFFALLRAGLWEQEVQLLPYGEVDYNEIMRLAEEQSVTGLVTMGLKHVTDTTVPKIEMLTFLGSALKIEEQNKAMNHFIGMMVGKLQKYGIYTTLIKGQGVAQCYERPLWRVCGDIDLFLDKENYEKAKKILVPFASHVDDEGLESLHLGMTIDSWIVELHGSMRTGLSRKVDNGIDEVQRDVFENKGVRVWYNDEVGVPLPNANNDAILVFTHFVHHFYGLGVGLRQICDWCRLLWTYKNEIDCETLASRLNQIGLMEEWQVFGAFVVKYLGMPEEVMPFYDSKFTRKSSLIQKIVLETGNFGHNRDLSYREKYPKPLMLAITFFRRLYEYSRFVYLFPKNALKFYIIYLTDRIKAVFAGKV